MIDLGNAALGTVYAVALAYGGSGSPPYSWSITAGALPPGITLTGTGTYNAYGLIEGTPTAVGAYDFTITATDLTGGTWVNQCSLSVFAPVVFTGSSAPYAQTGVAYFQATGATGGTPPYTFTITSGALPPGILLDASTGALSGIPTTVGRFAFTLQVVDSLGSTSSENLSITVSSVGAIYSPLSASGIPSPILLVEIQTRAGNNYFWSESRNLYPSVLLGTNTQYLDWITGAPKFHIYRSTQTDTASISVQNISGNTVERDVSAAFSKYEFIGALLIARVWRGDSEETLFTFVGTISHADVDNMKMDLTVEGFGNYSAIIAPAYNIDVTCPLIFGSKACGSTSPTPCDQSYGGCLSLNRFAGVITQWDQECPNVQFAQPAPAVYYNPARPF